jgi:hypothetical protein
VAVGDWNNDGQLDLVTANYNSSYGNTLTLLLGNGDGSFRAAPDLPVDVGVGDVQAADFNQDGNFDLVTGHCFYDGVNEVQNISFHLGNGDGTFQAALSYPTISHPNVTIVGDFNGDGFPDVALAHYDYVSLLINAADWSTPPASGLRPEPWPVGGNPAPLGQVAMPESRPSVLSPNGDGQQTSVSIPLWPATKPLAGEMEPAFGEDIFPEQDRTLWSPLGLEEQGD